MDVRSVISVRRDTLVKYMVLHVCNALGVDYDPRFALIWVRPNEASRLLHPFWKVPWKGQGDLPTVRLVPSNVEFGESNLQDVFTIRVRDEETGVIEDIQVTPGTPVRLIVTYFAARSRQKVRDRSVFFEDEKLPYSARIQETSLDGQEGALVVLRSRTASATTTESEVDPDDWIDDLDDDTPDDTPEPQEVIWV